MDKLLPYLDKEFAAEAEANLDDGDPIRVGKMPDGLRFTIVPERGVTLLNLSREDRKPSLQECAAFASSIGLSLGLDVIDYCANTYRFNAHRLAS